MTAATFDCPHCGAKYPLKPVLIGKTVRCTACKNAFRLREDGIADKVAPSAAAGVSAPPTPAAPLTATKSVTVSPAPTKPTIEPTPNQPQSARLQISTPKAGLTRQQLEARKAMSESLKATMDDALGLEELEAADATPGKPGTERQAKAGTERKGKSSAFLKSVGQKTGKKPGKTPAILTNEGEREAANSRRWLAGLVVTIVVVGLLLMAALHKNERSAAVAAFTVELPSRDLRYGARLEAIQARAWVNTITPFIDLPAPRISSQHDIPATSLEPLRRLKGLTYVATAERWVTPEVAAGLAKVPAAGQEKIDTKLERDGAIQITAKTLRKELSAANLGDDEMTIVMLLLTQPSASAEASKLAALVTQGNLPTIHWCTVSGRKGMYVIDTGQGYHTSTADYLGILVSFSGDGWPCGWRFMTLAAAK